jgi:DNA repair exonuclease SbcCD nuclease subunit
MKVACITDTHISFKKSNLNFHNYFQKFYEDIFFPTLKEKGIEVVIHLGDAFDNRKGIDYWGLEWAQKIVYDRFRDLGITVYQICGNHDSTMRNTNKFNAIATLLRDYENVIPIVEPTEQTIGDTQIVFVPWICKDNEEQTFKLLQETSARLVFGHLELTGFKLSPGNVNDHGMTTEKFQKFDRVFSGHYHTQSNDGKVFYLGNPYQMFWADVDDQRGFHIFDLDSYELEFIENPYKIYTKLYYDSTGDNDIIPEDIQGKYVKLIVKDKQNISEYDEFISKLTKVDIIDLKIIETITVDDTSVNIEDLEVEDTLTILDKYIENSDFSLDKSIVKKVLHQVYQEALEVEV